MRRDLAARLLRPRLSAFDREAPGDLVARASGAGKTILFACSSAFYEPASGAIHLAGRALDEWPRDVLRAQIGYVEQEAPVLAGRLRDHLFYARPVKTR